MTAKKAYSNNLQGQSLRKHEPPYSNSSTRQSSQIAQLQKQMTPLKESGYSRMSEQMGQTSSQHSHRSSVAKNERTPASEGSFTTTSTTIAEKLRMLKSNRRAVIQGVQKEGAKGPVKATL